MAEPNFNDMLDKLREELSTLAKFVDKTRQGVDTIESTVKAGSERFPEASRQLNTVTGDLENAANNMMTMLEGLLQGHDRASALIKRLSALGPVPGVDCPDGFQAIVKELEEVTAVNKCAIMDIFTGMSFHDLSGQKLKKVISSLSVIESKLTSLAGDFGLKIKEGPVQTGQAAQSPLKQDSVDEILKALRS